MVNNDGLMGFAVQVQEEQQWDAVRGEKLEQEIWGLLKTSGMAAKLFRANDEMRSLLFETDKLWAQVKVGDLVDAPNGHAPDSDHAALKQRGRELARMPEYARHQDLKSVKADLETGREVLVSELNQCVAEFMADHMNALKLLRTRLKTDASQKASEMRGPAEQLYEKLSTPDAKPDLSDLVLENKKGVFLVLHELDSDKAAKERVDAIAAKMADIMKVDVDMEALGRAATQIEGIVVDGQRGETFGVVFRSVHSGIRDVDDRVNATDAVTESLASNRARINIKKKEIDALVEETRAKVIGFIKERRLESEIEEIFLYPFTGRDARNTRESREKRHSVLTAFIESARGAKAAQTSNNGRRANGIVNGANPDLLIRVCLRDPSSLIGKPVQIFTDWNSGSVSTESETAARDIKIEEKSVGSAKNLLWSILSTSLSPFEKLLGRIAIVDKSTYLLETLLDFYQEHGRLPKKRELRKMGEAYDIAVDLSRRNLRGIRSVGQVIHYFGAGVILLNQDSIPENEAKAYIAKVPWLRGYLEAKFVRTNIDRKNYFVRKKSLSAEGLGS